MKGSELRFRMLIRSPQEPYLVRKHLKSDNPKVRADLISLNREVLAVGVG